MAGPGGGSRAEDHDFPLPRSSSGGDGLQEGGAGSGTQNRTQRVAGHTTRPLLVETVISRLWHGL